MTKSNIGPLRPLGADIVEKVGNRGAPKILPMSNVGDLSHCNALQDRYGRLWSLLRKSRWPLTSQRMRRTSGPENFQSSSKKERSVGRSRKQSTIQLQIAGRCHRDRKQRYGAKRCFDEIAWRPLMRVRARRFLRWATPLPSREQTAVFLRGPLVQRMLR
jgi:hypothetical protein